mgnify:CR=1 FL=1
MVLGSKPCCTRSIFLILNVVGGRRYRCAARMNTGLRIVRQPLREMLAKRGQIEILSLAETVAMPARPSRPGTCTP